MPKPVSVKQLRMMHAIAAGKSGTTSRGDKGPPASVASRYSGGKEKDLPHSKGKEHEGGRWPKGSGRSDEGRRGKKKNKKDVEKFEKSSEFRGAGAIVVDNDGRILLGKQTCDKKWAGFGGKAEGWEEFFDAAVRELKEEINIKAESVYELAPSSSGPDNKTYIVDKWSGTPKVDGREFSEYKWFDVRDIPWDNMRACCIEPLRQFTLRTLSKSKILKDMLYIEQLEKNVIRSGQVPDAVHDMSHGDALRLIGNGTFRMLREAVKDMQDEDFKDLRFDTYTIHLRRHSSDVYSGRVVDGNKMVHQFTNKSLPALTADLMSVFEWYLPEDEEELEIVDDLDDNVIHDGINSLIDNYKKHNIANIYDEMNNIRQEIRNSTAVDLQEVEKRIMCLFDKLESSLHVVTDKHNKLTSLAGDEINEIHAKLMELQSKIDELGRQPTSVEAYSSTPKNPDSVHSNMYMYLSKPQVEIDPSGKMRILFKSDWNHLDRSNFLEDMRAKVLKKGR